MIRHTQYKTPPVYEGELFVEKDPGDYEGKHRLTYRPGLNAPTAMRIWLGCKMCREQLGMSDPPRRVVADPKNWHEPSL